MVFLVFSQGKSASIDSSEIILPDLFDDGTTVYDTKDLFYFSALWMNRSSESRKSDLNGDGVVDQEDLLILANAYRCHLLPGQSVPGENTPVPTELSNTPTPGGSSHTPTPTDLLNTPTPGGSSHTPTPTDLSNTPTPGESSNTPNPTELSNTPTPTLTQESSPTPSSLEESTPTPTLISGATEIPTIGSDTTQTPTLFSESTSTPTPSDTPTSSDTRTVTSTPSPTLTPTGVITPSSMVTQTVTASPTIDGVSTVYTSTPVVHSTPSFTPAPSPTPSSVQGDATASPTPTENPNATPSADATQTPTPETNQTPAPTSTIASVATAVPTPTVYQPEYVRLWNLHPPFSLFSVSVDLPEADGYAASDLGYAVAATSTSGGGVFISFDREGRIFNRKLPISTSDYSGIVLSDGGNAFGKFFESPSDTRRFRFEPFNLDTVTSAMISVEHLSANSIAWAFCGSAQGYAMAALRYPSTIAVHRISADGQYQGVTEHQLPSALPAQPSVMMAAIGGNSIAVVYSNTMNGAGSSSPLVLWIFSLGGDLLTSSPIVINDEPGLNRLVGDPNGTFYLVTKSIYGLRLNRFSPNGLLLNKVLKANSLVDIQWQDGLLWLLDGEKHTMSGLNEDGNLANGPVFLYPSGWSAAPEWLRLKKSGSDLSVFFTDPATRNQVHYMQIEAGEMVTPTPLPASGAPTGVTESVPLAEGVAINLVKISRGTFDCGSPNDELGRRSNEGPQHTVTLTYDYYISETEITNRQYKAFDSSHRSVAYVGNDLDLDDLPVVNVSWVDANEFCEWLSDRSDYTFSLPSEAEWEYAARAGSATRRPWGDDLLNEEICSYANTADVRAASEFAAVTHYANCNDGFAISAPVASYPPNAFGVYDMMGNVREWCQDWFEKYTSASLTDPAGPSSGSSRVIRGGSWFHTPDYSRSAYRSGSPPEETSFNLGFRVAIREIE